MRNTLYSGSGKPRARPAVETPSPPDTAPVAGSSRRTWRDRYKRHERKLAFAAAGVFAALVIGVHGLLSAPVVQAITQDDIDAAVLRTLETKTLPSQAARSYEAVHRSIVRVRAIGDGLEHDEYMQSAAGTGVVVVDSGLILTSLHVVAGASRIRVHFADGLESDARVVSTQPENDLAVLQAEDVPDDLMPATVRPASDVMPGDEVIAVGFPFGIGPSVSAGVVSGVKREYRSPSGGRVLGNLIQFDAAVNPGSSGGPLVNASGEVVGIVTAILDPAGRGAFAGIGFAVPIETAAAAAGQPPF
jgi:S1-C subfamily serine protease